MKIKVLGSSIDGTNGRHFAASYVINGKVAIDAGTIGMISSIEEQKQIKHVFLSHPHVDHIASLPIFLDNVYQLGPECPVIYLDDFARDCLLRDVFNERLWPDLARLSQEESPFLRLQPLVENETVRVGDLHVTPLRLNHVVPTLGFVIEDGEAAVALVSDTSPTDEIWAAARGKENLRAVFLEAAFPNSMAWLADKAGHLTPAMFLSEYRKLDREVPVVAVHIKPAFYHEVVQDLQDLELSQLEISQPNSVYEF